jgi:hypothetical protein
MDTAHHQPAPIQILRDRRGVIIGRLEEQRVTGKVVARDARGLIVGTFDPREDTTRDARGLVVTRGNVLAAFLVHP